MSETMKCTVWAVTILATGTLGIHAQAPTPPSNLSVTSAAPVATPAPAPTTVGPKIQFATPVYDFGRVQAGTLVKYTYSFTNVGDEVLEIKGVQPQCGCTAANDWTKRVEPGQTGTISIQFNSANYNGGVVKNVTVTSNDKNQQQMMLQLKGTLWRPIEVNPMYAVMQVPADNQAVTNTVHVLNNMEEPITILEPQSNNRMFGVTVKTNQSGKDFSLDIYTLPPLPPGSVSGQQTLSGQITAKTSSTNMPNLSVSIVAIVQPPIVVSPAQIRLPQAPLSSWLTNSFNIQNNSTNVLELSDASANSKGVDVHIREMQPGKLFAAMVAFPPGFEIPSGKSVAVSIKSSNTRVPVITVPVEQSPRATPQQGGGQAPLPPTLKPPAPQPTSH
jgi:hypothetical protein